MRIKDRFNLFFDSLSVESIKTLGKRLFVLSVVLFILLSLFLINAVSPSAHAVDSVDFPLCPFVDNLSSISVSNISSFSPLIYSISSYSFYCVTSTPNSFLFWVYSGSSSSSHVYDLYCVTPDVSSYAVGKSFRSGYSSSLDSFFQPHGFNSSFNCSYCVASNFGTSFDISSFSNSFNVPIFSSFSEGLSSFRTWYDNGGSDPVEPVSSSFSLPAGYVAYVDIGSGSEYDLFVKANFGYNSSFGITTPQTIFGNTGQRFGWVSDLPSGSVQFPNGSVDTQFSWYKEAPTNLLGQSKSGGSPLHGSASSRYLVLYNPFYQPFKVGAFNTTPVSSARQNPTLFVSGTGFSGVKMYPLNQTSFFPDSVSVIDPDSIPLDGTPPEGGGIIDFTDPDGQIVVPSPGGDNAPLDDSSDTDIFSGFFGRIIGILTNGFDAIRRLTSESSSFFNFLSNLWSWLPPELSAFFISAVILIVIVGFFKAFL